MNMGSQTTTNCKLTLFSHRKWKKYSSSVKRFGAKCNQGTAYNICIYINRNISILVNLHRQNQYPLNLKWFLDSGITSNHNISMMMKK